MTARWSVGFLFLSLCLGVLSQTQLPELRDLDLSGWNCGLEGAAKSQDGKERNPQKNRSPIDLAGKNIPKLDTAAFLARAADYDRQIEKKHRRDLNPEQKAKVAELEKQILSVTGWLVLAYQGVPETPTAKARIFSIGIWNYRPSRPTIPRKWAIRRRSFVKSHRGRRRRFTGAAFEFKSWPRFCVCLI